MRSQPRNESPKHAISSLQLLHTKGIVSFWLKTIIKVPVPKLLTSFHLLCVYVYMCACTHARVLKQGVGDMHMCMYRPEVNLGCHSSPWSCFDFRQDLSLTK